MATVSVGSSTDGDGGEKGGGGVKRGADHLDGDMDIIGRNVKAKGKEVVVVDDVNRRYPQLLLVRKSKEYMLDLVNYELKSNWPFKVDNILTVGTDNILARSAKKVFMHNLKCKLDMCSYTLPDDAKIVYSTIIPGGHERGALVVSYKLGVGIVVDQGHGRWELNRITLQMLLPSESIAAVGVYQGKVICMMSCFGFWEIDQYGRDSGLDTGILSPMSWSRPPPIRDDIAEQMAKWKAYIVTCEETVYLLTLIWFITDKGMPRISTFKKYDDEADEWISADFGSKTMLAGHYNSNAILCEGAHLRPNSVYFAGLMDLYLNIPLDHGEYGCVDAIFRDGLSEAFGYAWY